VYLAASHGFLSGRPVDEVARDRWLPIDDPLVLTAFALDGRRLNASEELLSLALNLCVQEPRASVTIAAARTPEEIVANVAAALAPVSADTWRRLAEAEFDAGRVRLEPGTLARVFT